MHVCTLNGLNDSVTLSHAVVSRQMLTKRDKAAFFYLSTQIVSHRKNTWNKLIHSMRCYIQVFVRTEQGGSEVFEVSR
jgi:hypothetical protein